MIFKRKNKKEEGFTLIEILITIAILGTTLISLLSCFIYGFNILTRMKQISIATQCAQKQLETIRTKSFDEVLALSSVWTSDNLSRLPSSSGIQTIQDSAIGTDIKKITVSVTWTLRKRPMRRELVTYITREGVNKK